MKVMFLIQLLLDNDLISTGWSLLGESNWVTGQVRKNPFWSQTSSPPGDRQRQQKLSISAIDINMSTWQKEVPRNSWVIPTYPASMTDLGAPGKNGSTPKITWFLVTFLTLAIVHGIFFDSVCATQVKETLSPLCTLTSRHRQTVCRVRTEALLAASKDICVVLDYEVSKLPAVFSPTPTLVQCFICKYKKNLPRSALKASAL